MLRKKNNGLGLFIPDVDKKAWVNRSNNDVCTRIESYFGSEFFLIHSQSFYRKFIYNFLFIFELRL